MTKDCRPVSRRRLSFIERSDPLCNSSTHKFQTSGKIRATAQKMSKSGFYWNDKKSRFSLTVKQRFKNTSSRPIMTEEVFKSWMKLSNLKEKKFIVLIKETNDFDEINNFFMNNYWHKIGIFVKLWRRVSLRWKNWSDFKPLRSMDFREEDWSKIETLSVNSELRFRNYRMKLIVWMIERFKRCWIGTQWTIPRYQSTSVFSHLIQILAECQAVLWVNAEPQRWAAKHLGHACLSGNFFSNPTASSSALYPHEFNLSISNVSEHTSPHVMSEKAKHQFRIRDASQDRQPEIQSSLVREDFQRIMEQTNNDCRFQIFILTNSPRQQHSLVGR